MQGAHVVFGNTDFWSIMAHEVEKDHAPPDQFSAHASSSPDVNSMPALQRSFELEVQDGKTLVDAVASIANTTLERFVWSDLPGIKDNSNGKYAHCYHFDSKAVVKAYIESVHPAVANKTVYLQMTSYMTNWKMAQFYRPVKVLIVQRK
jgi:hypothetical protein